MHSLFTPFKENCADSCLKTLKEVQSYFETDAKVLDMWNTWYDRYAPKSDIVGEYVDAIQRCTTAQARYHRLFPLKSLHLFKPNNVNVSIDHWKISIYDCRDSIEEPGFQWPAILAACMASVATRFNPHPPEPRLFAVAHAQLQDLDRRYLDSTVTAYDTVTNMTLTRWLALKVDSASRPFTLGGKCVL